MATGGLPVEAASVERRLGAAPPIPTTKARARATCSAARRTTSCVVDPHAELVDAYLEAAAAIGSPIVAVFETQSRPTTSPACPSSSSALGRPRTARGDGRRVRARRRWPTAGRSSWEHARDGQSQRRDTRQRTSPTRSPTAARHNGAVARLHGRLAARRRRRPPRLAREGRAEAARARALHVVAEAARAPRWRGRVSEPFRRLGLRPRLVRQSVLAIGFERLHNTALQHADVDSFVDALLVDVPRRPRTRRRSSRPTSAAAPRPA